MRLSAAGEGLQKLHMHRRAMRSWRTGGAAARLFAQAKGWTLGEMPLAMLSSMLPLPRVTFLFIGYARTARKVEDAAMG